jgi:hypothetical protein
MAASYVKARTVTPATYDAWVNNIVQLPAQTEARPLVVRIIGKDATAGKLAYFYLDYMEKALLRRPMMYI